MEWIHLPESLLALPQHLLLVLVPARVLLLVLALEHVLGLDPDLDLDLEQEQESGLGQQEGWEQVQRERGCRKEWRGIHGTNFCA